MGNKNADSVLNDSMFVLATYPFDIKGYACPNAVIEMSSSMSLVEIEEIVSKRGMEYAKEYGVSIKKAENVFDWKVLESTDPKVIKRKYGGYYIFKDDKFSFIGKVR